MMRNKEDVMMNCNWIFRNLMVKKNALKEAGFDISLLDNEQKVNDAFKKSGLKMPNMNNRGIA
jgi:hypothetical protein|tara:strand:+ start:68 stop:256 length:189 start_codon:yes stop_codon:yes gene_type:complete